jgi:hypothetical protein
MAVKEGETEHRENIYLFIPNIIGCDIALPPTCGIALPLPAPAPPPAR